MVAGVAPRCRAALEPPPPHTFAAHNPDCSVTMPRPAQRVAPLRLSSSRPAQLQSSFLAPVAGLKGLCASFAREWRRACGWEGRWPGGRRGAAGPPPPPPAASLNSPVLTLSSLARRRRDGAGCGAAAGAQPHRPAGGVQQQEGPGLHAPRHPPVRGSRLCSCHCCACADAWAWHGMAAVFVQRAAAGWTQRCGWSHMGTACSAAERGHVPAPPPVPSHGWLHQIGRRPAASCIDTEAAY